MMVTVHNLVHRYAKATVLQISSLAVARGERWLIAGPSGSGKTTLLAILAGLLRPAQGTVTVAGKELSAMPESALDAWRGRAVGYVPQRLHLINSLTVLDNLLLAQYLAGEHVDRKQGMALLQTLEIEHLSQRLPHELSQGQAQRVAVARAVINKPALLLADEPTAALDDAQADHVMALLTRQASAAGATLAVASHDGRIRSQFEHVLSLPTEGSA
jgi:ABC-type lipoprotein export system ATPase subunit